MKVIVAIAVTSIVTMVASCGIGTRSPATSGPSADRSTRVATSTRARSGLAAPVAFYDFEYSALISNAGSAHAFTAFAHIERHIVVMPSSAAKIITVASNRPGFATASERARWLAAGSPPMPVGASKGSVLNIPAGTFSFIPQGTALTYREVRALPGSAQKLTTDIVNHLRPAFGTHVPAELVARQLGFLLATAPLGPAARSAAWQALVATPGLRTCSNGVDSAGREGRWLCVKGEDAEVEVLVAGTNSVLAIKSRILNPSPSFPGVPTGGITELDSFAS